MIKFDLNKIRKINWLQRWAGSYTFISCSYWGPQYFYSLKRLLKVNFNHVLFIHRKGVVSFYLSEKEFRHLGQYLARKSEKDYSFAIKSCEQLRKNTDVLSPIMKKFENKIPTTTEYKKFLKVFDRHLAWHVFVKKTIDFLSVRGLKKLLPYFTKARLYSERIYSESEKCFREIMKLIAKKENYNSDILTCLTQEEFESYIYRGILPKENLLKQRYQASVLYFENGKKNLFLGGLVNKIEKIIVSQAGAKKKQITGISAYPGRVVGKARIVLDPFKVKVFNRGDILITGMTRPEFLPLIKKAGAIITDVGGILCHAAIIARELKIPCIVGTAVATKVFKNNQTVEVLADKGTVKVK